MDHPILKSVPLLLLAAYVCKLMILGANQPEAIIAAFLCALVGMVHKHDSTKFQEEIQEQFKDLQKQIDDQTDLIAFQKTEVDAAKSYVASMKLSTQMRPKQL